VQGSIQCSKLRKEQKIKEELSARKCSVFKAEKRTENKRRL
jgi:hypothetical protein